MGALLLASTVALAAGPVSAAQLTLTWQDNAGGTAAFEIERSPGQTGEYTRMATTGAGAIHYADTTVPAGAPFCYRVRAVNAGGASGYSNVACGTAAVPPAIALAFAGVVRDRVGQRAGAPAPDGVLDGVFTLTLAPTSGARTATRLELRRQDAAAPWSAVWDTVHDTAWWTLGVAPFLDGQLLNTGSGMTAPLAAGGSLALFAADVDGLFAPGSTFTVAATFADGTAASATTTVAATAHPPPQASPSLTLAFAGRLRDRVSQSGGFPVPDGVADGTFTLTLAPGSGARTVTKLELTRHDSPDPLAGCLGHRAHESVLDAGRRRLARWPLGQYGQWRECPARRRRLPRPLRRRCHRPVRARLVFHPHRHLCRRSHRDRDRPGALDALRRNRRRPRAPGYPRGSRMNPYLGGSNSWTIFFATDGSQYATANPAKQAMLAGACQTGTPLASSPMETALETS
jgi:hypothetical protein